MTGVTRHAERFFRPAHGCHVLMTADAMSGVWNDAHGLAAALAPLGMHVTVAAMGPPPDQARVSALLALGNTTLLHRPYALEWMPGADADVDRAGEWLLELADRVKPDVVHINGYAHAALRFGVPTVLVARSYVCTWWSAVSGSGALAEWSAYRRRVAAGLAAASRVVASTHAMLDARSRDLGVRRAALVIPNGVAARGHAARPRKCGFALAAAPLWEGANAGMCEAWGDAAIYVDRAGEAELRHALLDAFERPGRRGTPRVAVMELDRVSPARRFTLAYARLYDSLMTFWHPNVARGAVSCA